ncbi:uncharacterized protein LOC128199280 [Bicyclus anynana]|uniref:Uncharacterized protein LOC128199280 n=1 Tax=Bicyclus anynana TaxID=110368 RepID=A0ABM3LYG5_BICAN|nr:uncharacterized protein LOC128199280 [Bicyclus anynana]
MYRQILIDEEHRNLQLILWREDESLPLETLQLNTVTYGFASASYLSTRCLWQLGEECEDEQIKNIIQHDFYVDDLITGSDNEEDLLYIQNSVSEALKKGCFNLRKYRSNSKTIYQSSTIDFTDNLSISESSSTLGLGWNPTSDTFNFPIQNPSYKNCLTKRLILSSSFKIFDPLGLLSPCIIKPKMIMQLLWLKKVGWDDPVPEDVKLSWEKFANNLDALSNIQIPRLTLCESPVHIELHSFSDASQSAYGACIYLRSINQNGYATVKLLCAKSKVAPLKPTTIPRLELSAALLSARLVKTTLCSLRCQVIRLVHWCDSTVVLGWLQSNARTLKTFVANRTVEICELTNAASWRYVPTVDNPADMISRGVDPHLIKDLELWWSGPQFLSKPECEWPQLKDSSNLPLPELEIKSHTVKIEPVESFIQMENYSKFTNLKRVTAYILRFIHNIKNPKSKTIGNLTIDELTNSFNFLCIVAQKQSFPNEYATLTKNKQLNSKSNILSLSPFIDDHNLIRVGGRIDASSLSYDQRHPILLHSSHYLTKLIFNYYHIYNLHAGPQLLLASVRQLIWPIHGRRLARNTVQKCVMCRRVQGKTLNPLMGNLPAQRITLDFPFRSVGVDLAGPFMTLNRKGRGARLVKTYLCLFICLRYKCLHLEAVSDLTKDALLMTFRRMISRRGKPAEFFSDNGKNLVGAANDIKKFLKQNKESIIEFATQEQIKFIFSPSYAPHFGGIWEAGVKSAKHHIKRVMGNTHLTFEEISTLFAQVEAILNSRPLCPLSPSPNDFLALTPGHFLIGRPITSLPSPDLTDHNSSSLQRYARLEQIRQHFWNRWNKEYVSELQNRLKWRTNDGPKLKIGDLVLIHEEYVPPLSWRMGRVTRMFPGRDGVSRVVDINTTKGSLRRPLTRICPLLPD